MSPASRLSPGSLIATLLLNPQITKINGPLLLQRPAKFCDRRMDIPLRRDVPAVFGKVTVETDRKIWYSIVNVKAKRKTVIDRICNLNERKGRLRMKVVVVGGTGNISASVVRVLLERGHEVTCFNLGKSGILPRGARLVQGDRRGGRAFEQNAGGMF